MSMPQQRIAALIAQAGYPRHHPIVVGLQQHGAPPTFLAQGWTSAGEPLSASTLSYTASLTKQITAACAALLVHVLSRARVGSLGLDQCTHGRVQTQPIGDVRGG